MAEVILKNIKKIYPHQEPKKKKKGEPEKKTNLQITEEGVLAVEKRRCPLGTALFLLFLVEVEIAAITTGPQCLGAAETDFFQVTEGVIVTFAEKTAGFRTAA